MMIHEPPDPVLRVLADLHPMTPSSACDRRVISRCHAMLLRQQQWRAPARSRPLRARVFDVAMGAAIGVYGVMAAIEGVRLTLVQ